MTSWNSNQQSPCEINCDLSLLLRSVCILALFSRPVSQCYKILGQEQVHLLSTRRLMLQRYKYKGDWLKIDFKYSGLLGNFLARIDKSCYYPKKTIAQQKMDFL